MSCSYLRFASHNVLHVAAHHSFSLQSTAKVTHMSAAVI
jgi:hypothetical protein